AVRLPGCTEGVRRAWVQRHHLLQPRPGIVGLLGDRVACALLATDVDGGSDDRYSQGVPPVTIGVLGTAEQVRLRFTWREGREEARASQPELEEEAGGQQHHDADQHPLRDLGAEAAAPPDEAQAD